jgi:hypothetical protein
MKLTVRTRNIIIATIIAIVGIFVFGYVKGRVSVKKTMATQINALKGQLTKYEVELDSKTVYVSQIEQELMTLREAKKAGDITNKELKALNLKQVDEISRLTLKIDTLLKNVPHTGKIDTVYINDMPYNAILLPFTFTKKDKWLTLNGAFNNLGILDIDLKLDASLDVYTGIDKATKKPTCLITSDNKYLGVLTVNSIKLDTPKDRKFGIGIQLGYGISKQLLTPYVGFGIQYSIIRF